jgi:hypothetical protein
LPSQQIHRRGANSSILGALQPTYCVWWVGERANIGGARKAVKAGSLVSSGMPVGKVTCEASSSSAASLVICWVDSVSKHYPKSQSTVGLPVQLGFISTNAKGLADTSCRWEREVGGARRSSCLELDVLHLVVVVVGVYLWFI